MQERRRSNNGIIGGSNLYEVEERAVAFFGCVMDVCYQYAISTMEQCLGTEFSQQVTVSIMF